MLTLRHVQFDFQRDLLEVRDQGLNAHVPAAWMRDRHVANVPIAVRAPCGRSLDPPHIFFMPE